MERSRHRWMIVISMSFIITSYMHVKGETFLYEKLHLQGRSSKPFLKRLAENTAALCAVACARLPGCVSFSLRPGPQGCSLYSNRTTVLDIADEMAPDLETFYNSYSEFCPSEKGYARVPGTQKCLRVERASKTWTEAEAACEAEGGHLAFVEDVATWQAVRTFLQGAAQGLGGIYVGGVQTSTGSWVWLDGFPVESSLWYPGEPSNTQEVDLCTAFWWYMRSASFSLLDDTKCSWSKSSLCEI